MFYSHELLTSKQYGVATVWLVATLGAKSNLKKVTRKAILDVDIPKACATITDPEAPLALRLQASLLYGVSRVHSQQCNYVLTDTQSFRDKMRGIAQVMKDLELDPDVGRTRPEQLNLHEDSGFIPELDLMFDLSAFDLPSDRTSSRASSLLSSFSLASSQTSRNLDDEDELALDVPSVDTPGDFGGFQLPPESSVAAPSVTKSAQHQHLLQHEDSAIINDPEFEFNEDGDLVAPASVRAQETPVGPMSETGISARVRAEHEAGWQAQENAGLIDADEGIVVMDDDDSRLPPADPFPPAVRNEINHSSDLPGPVPPAMAVPAASVSTESVAAPQRRVRGPRQAQADIRTELQNRDLGEWSTNYIENMADLAHTKEQHRSHIQAKKNAAFWILGQGIGGVQANFGEDREPHPLAVFSGQALLDALMGPDVVDQRSPGGSKRARSSSPQSQQARRVRQRTEGVEEEFGRGAEADGVVMGFDDDGIVAQDDGYNPESEVGRRGGSPLPDMGASILPWNRSASVHNSRYGSAQLGAGVSSSIGGAGGMRLPGGSSSALRGRHGSIMSGIRSRMLSASPLVGKGRRVLPDIDLDDIVADQPRLPSSDHGDGLVVVDVDDLDVTGLRGNDDFELYGPAANVDTQTAQMSQWMRQTLEDEALNFLGFVENVLSGGGTESQAGAGEAEQMRGEPRGSIAMDELLPPENNSAIVGAQALLHVLSLVTKGLLGVRQDEAFGDIVLWMESGSEGVADAGPKDQGSDVDVEEEEATADDVRGDAEEEVGDDGSEEGGEHFEEAVEHQEAENDLADDADEEDEL